MSEKVLPRIKTHKETFTVDYPEAIAFMDQQQGIFWPHYEVKVAKDKQDILVNMTDAERHGTIEVLRLFTKYEVIIGNEFWINWVMKKFPRPGDIQPMASMFGAMELAVHQMFYRRLNEELGIATDEFYNSYKEDEELAARISYLESALIGKDELKALGSFTFGEGAVLYTSFAYLKHFQSQGKNKLLNVVSGINFSARDEHLHSEAAAWLFRTLRKEGIEIGYYTKEYLDSVDEYIYNAANEVFEHEKVIIRKIFSKGKIEGITEKQLENFAMSRIDLCLKNLGLNPIYKVEYNPVADWFYAGINGYMAQDFFSSQGNQYARDWSAVGFVWEKKGD